MNIAIIFSYDGSKFSGSQKQPLKNTVEDTLLEVLRSIGINSKINLSGRTDKDVHATKQVANMILPHFWEDLDKLKSVLNQKLPLSIRIKSIKEVDKSFHARFSAKKRVYRYILTTNEENPFYSSYITYHSKINEEAIKEAIKLFIGKHDFLYFSKMGSEPKSTIREIFDAKFYKYKDIYVFKFTANSFLRSQIRIMVDFLLKISDRKLTVLDLKKQLETQEQVSKTLAPANGLYLTKVIFS